jgi:hypothetical protein
MAVFKMAFETRWDEWWVCGVGVGGEPVEGCSTDTVLLCDIGGQIEGRSINQQREKTCKHVYKSTE